MEVALALVVLSVVYIVTFKNEFDKEKLNKAFEASALFGVLVFGLCVLLSLAGN